MNGKKKDSFVELENNFWRNVQETRSKFEKILSPA